MGLTNWPDEKIKKEDVSIAKNYLTPEELDQLNRIVNQYLEFAELQVLNRKPMHMADWQVKLHGFLTLNDREILLHKGNASHQQAASHALKQFEIYRKQIEAAQVDELDKAIKKLPKPPSKKKKNE